MRNYLKRAEGSQKGDREAVETTVRDMIAAIRTEGDPAVRRFAAKLDRWEHDQFKVSEDRIRDVARQLPETFKEDFALCLRNVKTFAQRQRDSMSEFEAEIAPGIIAGQKLIPVSSVGCYVPGGKYPLISAAIMSVATARVAGVEHITGCAPPRDADGIFPHTLYALHAAGADEIYSIGGVQAMASMVFGRVGMRPVDMITGPGNAFVAEAKRQLFGEVGIDLPAGPTEILVIADDSADSELVAIDLLGQAEHGPDSPAWLVTTSQRLGREVIDHVERRLKTLPTRDIASVSWQRCGEVVVVDSDEEAVAVSDAYAPEHLELQTARDDWYLARLRNYGSMFVGEESTVAYGDKGVGTNHTLPTGLAARYTGGLWAGKFIKTVTYQRLTRQASHDISLPMGRMCEAEGMLAHAITCQVRRERYRPGSNRPESAEKVTQTEGGIRE